MKYLDSRDNYLKRAADINRIQQDKILEDLTTKLILEENEPGSGAFGNNVKWGDSLLGRFINFVIRKVGVGIDMGRISLVAKQLKVQFDRIISESAINSLDTDDKQEVVRVQISAILGVLKKAVYDGEKVGKIKSITRITISDLESLKVDEKSEESKLSIIKALEEFLKFLEKYKDEDGKGGPLSDDASKTEDSEESSSKVSIKTSYPLMVKNLKSLALVLETYKRFKPAETTLQSSEESSSDFYITKGGETIQGIQKDTSVNKNKLSLDQIWNQNTKVLDPYAKKAEASKLNKYSLQLAKGLKLSMSVLSESFIFEEAPVIGTGGGVNRNIATNKESHLSQAYNKLKKACEVLESSKEKGIGVTAGFINEITSKANDEKSKEVIKSLYKEMLRYLIGDKKSTIAVSNEPLYKESLDVISDKNKKVIVAEKIARFAVVALKFDGENLYGSLGELGNPLKQFVDTTKDLKNISPEELVDKKQESRLLKYDGYLSLIKEAEEVEKEGDDESNQVSKEIKDYFDKNLKFDAYLISEEEIKRIEDTVERVSKGKPKGIVIRGMNPIIEIVRLFNRAYKLHTTDVIPGARSGGKVDRLTFNEYTAFGGGSGEPSATEQGPYRHKKTFNIWEDAVMDVLSNTKYAPIFVKETKIDDDAGLVREGAGVALRQLMTDLLDGDNLYKSGGSGSSEGAQKKALEKYFGEAATDFFQKNSGERLGIKDPKTGKIDTDVNSENADNISVSNLQFTKSSSLTSDEVLKESKFKNTILQMRGKDSDGKLVTWYMFVNDFANDKYYVMISKTMAWFRNIVQSEYPSTEIDKGDSEVSIELRDRMGSGLYPIIHSVLTKKALESISSNRAKNIEIRGIVKEEEKSVTTTEKLQLQGVNWLVLKEMEDNKLKSQSILKLESKDVIYNSIKSIKPAFDNYREVVDKKYDDGKFTPMVELK